MSSLKTISSAQAANAHAGVYGVKKPDSRYNANCDMDDNGDVGIFDIVMAAGNYGENW